MCKIYHKIQYETDYGDKNIEKKVSINSNNINFIFPRILDSLLTTHFLFYTYATPTHCTLLYIYSNFIPIELYATPRHKESYFDQETSLRNTRPTETNKYDLRSLKKKQKPLKRSFLLSGGRAAHNLRRTPRCIVGARGSRRDIPLSAAASSIPEAARKFRSLLPLRWIIKSRSNPAVTLRSPRVPAMVTRLRSSSKTTIADSRLNDRTHSITIRYGGTVDTISQWYRWARTGRTETLSRETILDPTTIDDDLSRGNIVDVDS